MDDQDTQDLLDMMEELDSILSNQEQAS